MLITKKFKFDSAHKLLKYPGKCRFLHGHTYYLAVSVYGKLEKKTGMIIDFTMIEALVQKNVIDILDHHFINDIVRQPTAENLAVWIWNRLEKVLNLYKIELWETSDSSVTYYGKDSKNY
jgi:6-pyruvoyltetrahydropterin/6-carboxytetrahydropterin synthase